MFNDSELLTKQLFFLAKLLHWEIDRIKVRSSSTSTLVVPPTRLSTTGDRAFLVAAARIWNSLSRSLTSLPSLASFRRQLKTELFTRSFPDLDSSAHDRIWQILCSHFASHSRFVTVFNVCKVSLQSFDITPPKSFLSIIIIIIITRLPSNLRHVHPRMRAFSYR